MHFQTLFATLALVSTAATAPFAEKGEINATVSRVTGSQRFTVAQDQPKRDGRKLAGPIALANALSKYEKVGLSPSPAVKAAASQAAKTDDGTVAANPGVRLFAITEGICK